MLTIDVERDWAGDGTRSIDEVLPRMVEVLAEQNVSATFFIVAELIERAGPYLLGTPHEVASHGLTHQRLGHLSEQEQRHEIAESKRRIESSGFTVDGFRAPFLETTKHTAAHLEEAGYRYNASSGGLLPGRADTDPLAVATMRAGLPFTMTWLRMIGPHAIRLAPANGVLLCHLHEFLSDSPGWSALPSPFRKMHRRNSGDAAWRILSRLLDDHRRTWSTVAAVA